MLTIWKFRVDWIHTQSHCDKETGPFSINGFDEMFIVCASGNANAVYFLHFGL